MLLPYREAVPEISWRLTRDFTASAFKQSDSPLYTPPASRTPNNRGATASPSLLTLDPHPSQSNQMSNQQLMLMEEAQPVNTYLSARSEAIEAIERTINELGGIFKQLAQMVSEQSEMIQRIDAETEDVVTNVSGAQRELMKYWGRVSSNRWLVVKMFGGTFPLAMGFIYGCMES